MRSNKECQLAALQGWPLRHDWPLCKTGQLCRTFHATCCFSLRAGHPASLANFAGKLGRAVWSQGGQPAEQNDAE